MTNRTEIAALLLRLGLGTMFIAHGLLKVMVFTLPGTVGFFEQVGFREAVRERDDPFADYGSRPRRGGS